MSKSDAEDEPAQRRAQRAAGGCEAVPEASDAPSKLPAERTFRFSKPGRCTASGASSSEGYETVISRAVIYGGKAELRFGEDGWYRERCFAPYGGEAFFVPNHGCDRIP